MAITVLPTASKPAAAAPVYTPVPAPVYPAGSWGGTAPRPPVTNYPTLAQQQALNLQEIPGAWGNWFAQNIQPLATYYTPERGGPKQAQRDWYNFQSYWTNRTGRPLTTEDMSRLMVGFQGYASRLGRAASLADLYDYTGRSLAEQGKPPQISYLKVGEF